MFHKKTLGAAIAVALSFGVSAVQAADFQKYVPKALFVDATTPLSSVHQINKPLNYAYEQFGDSVKSGILSFPYRVRYTLTKSIPNTFDFYITFTLSGDVTWGGNLSSQNLRIQDATGMDYAVGTVPDVSIVNKGSTTDNTVSFLINSSKSIMEPTHFLNFEFLVSNANNVLKTPGGQITLTANLTIAQTAKDFITGTPADQQLTTVLGTSAEGTDIEFRGPDDGNPAYISVVSDGKTFEGPGKINDTQVAYGAVGLKNKPGLLMSAATCVPHSYLVGGGAGVLPCGAGQWDATGLMLEGQVLIEDGNFSASGKASDGNVYIDTTTKIVADEFTNVTSAEWILDVAELDAILVMGNTNKGARNLVLTVKGDTEIVENRQVQPKGTLVIKFDGGNSVTRSAFLRHLKKNGTVCTLYNIPPSDALDIINIRITNDSPGVDGFVKGKLRDMDNKVIFTGKTLIEQGGLKPHQTVRLQMEDLKADGASWEGRAVLVLESNIPHPLMQVYGLLRAREATGFPETPLMNMSTGATGNSCD